MNLHFHIIYMIVLEMVQLKMEVLASEKAPIFRKLITALEEDFTQNWIYKDLYRYPSEIGVTEELFKKSIANNGNKRRLQKILVKALEGDTLDLIILGGSISRGAPFSERGLDSGFIFTLL